jgi:hypothetical protein
MKSADEVVRWARINDNTGLSKAVSSGRQWRICGYLTRNCRDATAAADTLALVNPVRL